jgi:hypothetical protein
MKATQSTSNPEILAANKQAHVLPTQRGHKPQQQKLNNEASTVHFYAARIEFFL